MGPFIWGPELPPGPKVVGGILGQDSENEDGLVPKMGSGYIVPLAVTVCPING